MKIAVLGAGFTGLSASLVFQENKHKVTIFEKDDRPGGLAMGYRKPNWKWTLESHYHHWFTNDSRILSLAKKLNYKVLTKRPKTSVWVDGGIYQLDSPVNLLKFPKIPFLERVRMGAVIFFLRYNPFWLPLEKFRAEPFLKIFMGSRGYKKVWEPLLVGKFGKFSKDISLAWFWARVRKRTSSLAYPEGGFLKFAEHILEKVEKDGGNVYMNEEVLSISEKKGKVIIKTTKRTEEFDKAIVTLPSFLFIKISKDLPESYTKKLMNLSGLGAVNLILRLKKPFLNEGTYWLNVCDKKAPVLAIVEHTNFINKRSYGNEHILYLGNYLPHDHEYFEKNDKELLEEYHPLLKKLNKDYKSSIIGMDLFKVPFAQPIIPVNYSKRIPPVTTPIENVYLANIQQVYPWDRGTNYAVELGQKVADLICREEN